MTNQDVVLYYDTPAQVKYLDIDSGYEAEEAHYVGAIAYCGELICGCCGSIIDIKELYDLAREMGIDEQKVIVPYDSWVDIEREIRGDD